MATVVVEVMAAVVLLDDESGSRRLQVQIQIQMQIRMHVQIQIQMQAHVPIHIQVRQFPEPYMVHGNPRDISTEFLGFSAGIMR